MFTFSLCLMGFFCGDWLAPVHQYRLKVQAASHEPAIVADCHGNIFYRDYWEHKIYKIDPSGELIYEIGGQGEGPGELQKPFRILLMDDEQTLLVLSMNGLLQRFATSDGRYLGTSGRFPANQLLHWKKDLVLGLGGIPGKPLLRTYDVSKQSSGPSWFPAPTEDPDKWYTRAYACATNDEITFFQDGSWPELWVIEYGTKTHDVWKLVLPKNYRPLPKQALNSSYRYDQHKVSEYLASYTHLNQLFLMGDYLLVGWRIHEPYPAAMDLYHWPTRKKLVSVENLPGSPVAMNSSAVYVLEEVETEDDFYHRIHIYALDLKQKEIMDHK